MGKKKYLPLYYQWLDKGVLPENGLCFSLPVGSLDDFNQYDGSYWGHEDGYKYEELCYPASMKNAVRYEFTPMRQNIVLFLAAMNNEL